MLVIVCIHSVSGVVRGPGPDTRGRQKRQESIILLVTASAYKRPQTAAAPTLSSPCSRHKSVNEEMEKVDFLDYTRVISFFEH